MKLLVLLALLFAAPMLGPTPRAARTQVQELDVVASTYPLLWLVERVGGDVVRARCPVPDGSDPAHWRPDDDELARIQRAPLIVLQGAGYERWTAAASLPLGRVVDTTRPFAKELLVRADETVHRHGKEGEHSHRGVDPHTWLEPSWLARQAGVIAERLALLRAPSAAAIEERLAALRRDLDRLDEGYRALGNLPEGEVLLAAHPAYDYLAGRYGFPVESLDLDPQEPLDDAALAALVERARGGRARFLLWEEAPLPENAERVRAQAGLTSLVVSPCETLSAERRAAGLDLLSVLRANLHALAPAFEAPGDAPPR
jgi:zinc transport system substrate-binding protein